MYSDNNSYLITPPDKLVRMTPAVLLVDVEPYWIQKIVTFLESSETTYTLYDCQGDMDWGFKMLHYSRYVILNLNNPDDGAILKGYALGGSQTYWYSDDSDWEDFNCNVLADPLEFFLKKEIEEVGADITEV